MKAFLLAISVAILGCSSVQFGGARIDRGLAALVPADTILLAGVRMSEVRTTPLYTRMISQQRLSELNDFAKQTKPTGTTCHPLFTGESRGEHFR